MEHLPRCRRKGGHQGAPLKPGLSPFFVQDRGPHPAPRAAWDNHGTHFWSPCSGPGKGTETELTAVLGGMDGSKDHCLGQEGSELTASYSLVCLWSSPRPTPQAGAAQGQIPKGQCRPCWKVACLRLKDTPLTHSSGIGSGQSPEGWGVWGGAGDPASPTQDEPD